MGSTPTLEVVELGKVYKDFPALSNLNFSLYPGEILAFVGPNGAGKTTTLRILAGIIPPTGGTVRVASYDLQTAPVAAKRQLAFVPDSASLFDALTVWEHLQFIGQAYEVPDPAPRAEALLEQFELTDKRNALGHELSHGMKQKVMICCGLLHDPRLILFDEPITGLDPYSIRTLRQEILNRAAAGAVVIVSSHILQWVEDLCTHLLLIDKGQRRFFNTMEAARNVVGSLDKSQTLEEVFFSLTGAANQPPTLPPGSPGTATP